MKLKIQYTVHLLNSREKTDGKKKINIAYRNYGNITKDSPDCHSNTRESKRKGMEEHSKM